MICTGIFFVLSFEATPSEFGLQNFLPYQIKGFVDFISNFNPKNLLTPRIQIQTESLTLNALPQKQNISFQTLKLRPFQRGFFEYFFKNFFRYFFPIFVGKFF